MSATRDNRLRVRCLADDGTDAHVAADLELPAAVDAVTGLLRLKVCTCGLDLAVLIDGAPEPKDDPERYAEDRARAVGRRNQRAQRSARRKGGAL